MKGKKPVRAWRVFGVACTLCLMLCLCAPAAFADTAEEYVVIGSVRSMENDLTNNITLVGMGLIALGVVGIICVLVWSAASSRNNKTQDEEIYQAVGMADARNRASNRAGENRRPMPPPGQRPPPRRAPPPQRVTQGVTGEVFVPKTSRAAPKKRARTPNAQPRRQRITEFQDYYSVAPQQRTAPPSVPKKQGAPAPKATGYDTDEIIREALHKRD